MSFIFKICCSIKYCVWVFLFLYYSFVIKEYLGIICIWRQRCSILKVTYKYQKCINCIYYWIWFGYISRHGVNSLKAKSVYKKKWFYAFEISDIICIFFVFFPFWFSSIELLFFCYSPKFICFIFFSLLVPSRQNCPSQSVS